MIFGDTTTKLKPIVNFVHWFGGIWLKTMWLYLMFMGMACIGAMESKFFYFQDWEPIARILFVLWWTFLCVPLPIKLNRIFRS